MARDGRELFCDHKRTHWDCPACQIKAAREAAFKLEARADSYLALLEELLGAVDRYEGAQPDWGVPQPESYAALFAAASSIRTQLEGK